MSVGESHNFEPMIDPPGAPLADLSWSSGDPSTVSVDITGRVTANSPGATVITVATPCGLTATSTVTVRLQPTQGLVTVFRLADHLAGLDVGETGRDAIFEGIPLTPAGGYANVTFEVIDFHGRNALRMETIAEWAGLDLVHTNWAANADGQVFDFRPGDTINISGLFPSSEMAGARALFFGLGSAWDPPLPVLNVSPDAISITDGRPFLESGPYAFFNFEYAPMTVSDVMDIASASPPSLRFRGITPGAVYIITDLIVERNPSAPTVTIGNQIGSLDPGIAGQVSFPVTANFLASPGLTLPGAFAFGTASAQVTGLPDGVFPSGTISLDANGTGTGTLTLTAGPSANLGVGTHGFNVNLVGTGSMPADLTVRGFLFDRDEVLIVGETGDFVDVGFFVEAFGLDSGGVPITLPLTTSGDLPPGIVFDTPNISVNAAGNGTAFARFTGTLGPDSDGTFPMSLVAGGLISSPILISISVGVWATVFDMQDLDEAEAEVHFAGCSSNRGVISVAPINGNLVVSATGWGTGPGGTSGTHNPLMYNWVPLTILRQGQHQVGNVVTVTGSFGGTPEIPFGGLNAGQMGLFRGGLLPGDAMISTHNNLFPTFTVTHTITEDDVNSDIDIRWNLWGGGLNPLPATFIINIYSVVIEEFRAY